MLSEKTLLFIEKANKVHVLGKYDYSLVDYIHSHTKVKIGCKNCKNDFEQRPTDHLKGSGCPFCAGNITSNLDSFVKKANEKHNEQYSYEKSLYVNCKTKLIIGCKECKNDFEQRPSDHLSGYGCPFCGGAIKSNLDSFVKKANEKHNEQYSYEKSVYVNAYTKLIICCKECKNDFEQRPSNHLTGKGCPFCNNSKGEIAVQKFLNKIGFSNVKQQYRFPDCKNINTLPFDFYIPDFDICIEYQGVQHYEHVNHFGGEEKLKKQQLNDLIKRDYCAANNLRLLEIRYDEDVETTMIEFFRRIDIWDDIDPENPLNK